MAKADNKPILDVIGHEDVKKEWEDDKPVFFNDDPNGDPQTDREDPGPAFPMASFRARVLGLQEGAPEDFQAILTEVVSDYRWLIDQPKVYGRQGTAGRTGPKALVHNEVVQVIDRQYWWAKVVAKNDDGTTFDGWIPERYLKRILPPDIETVPPVKDEEVIENKDVVTSPQDVTVPAGNNGAGTNAATGNKPQGPKQPRATPN